ncbi:MAG: rod shape-determining protein MreD [Rhodospirillales bacterium]
MKPTAWRRLDLFARELMPFALTLGLILVGAIPFYVPGLQSVAPSLPFIAVFYWTLHRPDLMPAAAAFLIGLFQDVLSGAPIGTGAAVFVVMHAAVQWQRSFFHGKSFPILWLGFAVATVAAALLTWLIMAAMTLSLVDGRSVLLQALTTIGCFPLVVRVLWYCHLNVLKQA